MAHRDKRASQPKSLLKRAVSGSESKGSTANTPRNRELFRVDRWIRTGSLCFAACVAVGGVWGELVSGG
jgi:hypothetical protein